jgi:hypothetical protein
MRERRPCLAADAAHTRQFEPAVSRAARARVPLESRSHATRRDRSRVARTRSVSIRGADAPLLAGAHAASPASSQPSRHSRIVEPLALIVACARAVGINEPRARASGSRRFAR